MMNKYFTFIFLVSLAFKSNCQTLCNCEAIIDVEYKKKISLFEKPNGQVIKEVKHNVKNDDFLTLIIEKDSLDYFKVNLRHSISGDEIKGWIKKNNYIGTFARNYNSKKRLNLYSKPNLNSEIKSTVNEWTNQLYVIHKCSQKWVYVKIKNKGKIVEGWLQPEMQCPNIYTTCN